MKKDYHIETLRGSAISLVVIYHVLGFLQFPEDSWWRQLHVPFDYLRMPLFTVISGYIYSMRPVRREKLLLFLRKKTQRLMIPWATWTLITFSTFGFIYSEELTLDTYLEALFMPYLQYWYLQGLVVVFLIVTILELSNKLSCLKHWAICFTISLSLLVIYTSIYPAQPVYARTFFSHSRLFYLFPFFLIGLGIQRFRYRPLSFRQMTLLFLVFICGVFIKELIFLQLVDDRIFHKFGLVGIGFGLISTLYVMNLKVKNSFLIFLGSFAYPIYLMHMFAEVLIAALYEGGLVKDYRLMLVLMLTASFAIPILLTLIFNEFRISRLIFMGTSKKKTYFLPNLQWFYSKKLSSSDASGLTTTRSKESSKKQLYSSEVNTK